MHASALLAVAAAAVVLSTYIPAAGQTVQTKAPAPAAKTGPVPRTADGKPDLSGFWNMGALRYGGNLAMGKESEVPYTDAGRAAYKNHDAERRPHRILHGSRHAPHAALAVSHDGQACRIKIMWRFCMSTCASGA